MPAVTRIGDADVTHCSGMTRAEGSPNVFVNSIAVSRQGDNNTGHLLPGSPCPSHTAPITTGSTTVFINGKGCFVLRSYKGFNSLSTEPKVTKLMLPLLPSFPFTASANFIEVSVLPEAVGPIKKIAGVSNLYVIY